MTPTPHDDCGPMSQFAKSRARAQRERTEQRNRAVRTVAGHARDRNEFTGLLSMLGLDDGRGGSPTLSRSLAAYVQRVAAAVGVPVDAVGYEVSDTATAYLGLTDRLPEHAGRDLMLVWDERLGWYIGVETRPDETPLVLGYLAGETVPPPATVAQFVSEAVAGRRIERLRPVVPPADRITLARRMAAQTQS
ncbi:MAG TPA: DUF6292 family protein [Actinophytocola sp.]|jgi:hypothetical protein|uniref:DUF6292 family protein n=1 Tax=Actinophytocola sp. TaxID=1872138 RepID=UPI002F926393